MNWKPNEPHVLHVARLALLLFDQLHGLHQLGPTDRALLEAAAARLHDIGWAVTPGGKEHHKASARLIRERAWKSLEPGEVAVLALVARNHRQSLPDPEHKVSCALRRMIAAGLTGCRPCCGWRTDLIGGICRMLRYRARGLNRSSKDLNWNE